VNEADLRLTRLAAFIVLLTRSDTTNQVEIIVLRHQLAVLQSYGCGRAS